MDIDHDDFFHWLNFGLLISIVMTSSPQHVLWSEQSTGENVVPEGVFVSC